jgi:DNA-binding NtrC family response regulator
MAMTAGSPRATRLSRILIIDDDPTVQTLVAGCLGTPAYAVAQVGSARDGLRQVEEWHPDVVLLDHLLPDRHGIEVLSELVAIDRQLPVLFITAAGTSQIAIEAVRRGSFDYLSKPLSPVQLSRQIEQALENRRLLRRPVVVNPADDIAAADSDILIGRSESMLQVYKAIGRIAASGGPALVTGATGTGKELIARAIHQHSARSEEPLLVLHCADYAPRDLEDVLLGGGDETLLHRAGGGSLILQEVGCIPLGLQLKLLERMRAHATHRPPGSADNEFPTLLFTTSVDPDLLMAQRQLRRDLYYDLSGGLVRVAPLCERTEDIPLLVEHCLAHFARIRTLGDAPVSRVSDEAMQLLLHYPWPGNVAELRSIIRRALMETRGTVLAGEFLKRALGMPSAAASSGLASSANLDAASQAVAAPGKPSTNAGSSVFTPGDGQLSVPGSLDGYWRKLVQEHAGQADPRLYFKVLEMVEQGLIAAALEQTQGNVSQAARLLGITRVSLRKKARGLPREATDDES